MSEIASHSSRGRLQAKSAIAGGDEILVLDRPQPLAGAGEFGIVVIDHQRFHLGERERLLHQLGEFAVDDQHLGFGMVELERDDGGVEPGVDGVEHGAGHRHAVVAFEHGGRIGEHGGDGVAALDAAAGERAREAARAGVEFGVAALQPAMDDGGAIGKDRGAPLQERQRGERLEVCRIAIEIDVVGRHVHHQPAAASLRMVSVAINPAAATIARPAWRRGDRPRSRTASARQLGDALPDQAERDEKHQHIGDLVEQLGRRPAREP